jgi:hypothetical protein
MIRVLIVAKFHGFEVPLSLTEGKGRRELAQDDVLPIVLPSLAGGEWPGRRNLYCDAGFQIRIDLMWIRILIQIQHFF